MIFVFDPLAGVIEVHGVRENKMSLSVSSENSDAVSMAGAQIKKFKMLNNHALLVVYGHGGIINDETN